MKIPVLPLTALFLAAACQWSPALAQASSVSVRVEQVNKTERDDSKKYKRTYSRALNIFVQNGAAELTDLKVKYVIFGREADGLMVTLGEGEHMVSARPRMNEKVETKSTTVTFEDEHLDKGKKIPDTGYRIIGHGVRVFQGDKVVAESYDPASLKAEWGKTGPVPKTLKK